MNKLFVFPVCLFLYFITLSTNSYAIYDAKNWIIHELSDPMTDEKSVTLCKGSNEMWGNMGQEALLCVKKTENKMLVYIQSEPDYWHGEPKDFKVLVRFGSNKPTETVYKSIGINKERFLFLNNPLSVIEDFKKDNKFAIKIYEFSHNDPEKMFTFNLDSSDFYREYKKLSSF